MSSPAPPSVGSCCAEVTRCAWRSRLTCLAWSSRWGLLRSPTGRTRREQITCGHGFLWLASGSDQRVVSSRRACYPGLGGEERDADVAGNGADLLVAHMNEQRLAANVAEYHGIPLAALHVFPARIMPSGWLYSSITKDGRRRPTPCAWLARGNRTLDATDGGRRIAGDPGLRRALLARAGGRMGGTVADGPSSAR